MRTVIDAHRSLKRYVALALGSEWEVRLADEEGAFKRPFCRVGASAQPRINVEGARHLKTTQRFAIVAYPTEKVTATEARMEAMRVEELFTLAFGMGVHVPSQRPERQRAHPFRVPLYDYDGIALDAAATEDDREPNDFLIVDDTPNIGSLVDESDQLLWVTTVDIAMWWSRSVAVLSSAMPVERVDVTREAEVEA